MKTKYNNLLFILAGILIPVTACTNSNIISSKTNEIKSSQKNIGNSNKFIIVDLGNKNGPSTTIKFNFGKGFKVKDAGSDQIDSLDHIRLVISNTAPSGSDYSGTYTSSVAYTILSQPLVGEKSVTFQGLKFATDYYIAARAFSDSSETTNITSADGTSGGTAGGTQGSYNNEYISVDNSGRLRIINDTTPMETNMPNDSLDMIIQLKSLS